MKHLSRYLPYHLWCVDETGIPRELISLADKRFDCSLNNPAIDGMQSVYRNVNRLLPILRPVELLYKSIVHNGEIIIPIVKLREKAERCSGKDFKIFNDTLYYETDVPNSLDLVYENQFWYSIDNFQKIRKTYSKKYNYVTDFENSLIIRQTELFEYMNELKIDYLDLINQELAKSSLDFKEIIYK